MNRRHNGKRTRRGFTIVELLVVISVMAVIATLAIGAAIKSVKQSSRRRIDTMARALEMALSSYRAQENAWPFDVSDLDKDPRDSGVLWAHGANNVKVFKKMYPGAGSSMVYLDASAFLSIEVIDPDTKKPTRSLRSVLNLKQYDKAALGYPLPDNPNRFCYYCVCYFPLTDTVKVLRQDEKHPAITNGGKELDCPDWNKQ